MTEIPEPSAEDMRLPFDPSIANAGHWGRAANLHHVAVWMRRAYHAERKLAALEKRIAESPSAYIAVKANGIKELYYDHPHMAPLLHDRQHVRLVPVEEP